MFLYTTHEVCKIHYTTFVGCTARRFAGYTQRRSWDIRHDVRRLHNTTFVGFTALRFVGFTTRRL